MGVKEAYQDKADAQLREWRAWIETIKSNPTTYRMKRPMDQQRVVKRLDDCYRIARVRLDELRSSQDDHWEFAKQAVERAMIELKRALDESGAELDGRFLQLQPNRSHVYEPFHQRKK